MVVFSLANVCMTKRKPTSEHSLWEVLRGGGFNTFAVDRLDAN